MHIATTLFSENSEKMQPTGYKSKTKGVQKIGLCRAGISEVLPINILFVSKY